MNDQKPMNIPSMNEEERVKALHRYQLLETPIDFDTVVTMAAEILEMNHAFVNFITEDSVLWKVGLSDAQHYKVSRTNSLCEFTLVAGEITVFNDPYQHPVLAAALPLSGMEEIRFYAAVPLKTPDGFIIGTLGVTDKLPHLSFGEKQVNTLKQLASVVMEKLESRFNHKNEIDKLDAAMHRLVHDIKNPLTSITLYAQILAAKEMEAEKVFTMAGRIEKATQNITSHLNNSLKRTV